MKNGEKTQIVCQESWQRKREEETICKDRVSTCFVSVCAPDDVDSTLGQDYHFWSASSEEHSKERENDVTVDDLLKKKREQA